MFDFYLLAGYVAAIVLFLGTPGPVTVLVANSSVRGGVGAGLLTVAGTNTSSLVLISASFLAIQGVFLVDEGALTWLAFLGSFYLIYFSISVMLEKVSVDIDLASKPRKNYFLTGFAVGISNPKDMLFFMAFFPAFFGLSSDILVSMTVLVVIWVVLDYIILSLYAFVFSRYISGRVAYIVSKLSGGLLFAVAVYSLYVNYNKLPLAVFD